MTYKYNELDLTWGKPKYIWLYIAKEDEPTADSD
jgi:hypothetical protein